MRASTAARSSALVIVEVGAEKTKYTVHRSFLTEHSEYFRKALTGSWKEAQEGVVTLEDVDCDGFNIFVDWMYTRKLPRIPVKHDDSDDSDDLGDSNISMLKALVPGDRILALNFHRAVRDAIIEDLIVNCPWYKAIIYGFANLPKDHPVLDLMVASHCLDYTDNDDTKENGDFQRRSQLPVDFLIRVMLRYSFMKSQDWSKCILDPCDYHGHVSEEDREKYPVKMRGLKQKT
ncbi:BTB domain containing protein [Pyrenophora tritici-repentis]|nr:BTB domain containing protein [Pyrenophora tritici-repentis]